jgi:hypothetical protein
MRRWKTAGLAAAGMGAAFVLLEHGFRSGGTLRSVEGVGLIGVVIGALAAPDFAPELFPAPALWQAIVGACGGALLALLLGATAPGIAAAAITGGVLGALARHWIKHV